jgi:hypothetical protein
MQIEVCLPGTTEHIRDKAETATRMYTREVAIRDGRVRTSGRQELLHGSKED